MASLRGTAFVLLSFASFFAGGGVQVGSAAAAGEFAARPDLDSSSFTATAGGGLRIGVEYGKARGVRRRWIRGGTSEALRGVWKLIRLILDLHSQN
jgi:hypothetical protein